MSKRCRVGITTDPSRRKRQWESETGSSLPTWQEYGPYATRQEAQTAEDQLARINGCTSHHGGANPDKPSDWYVYVFYY